MLTVGTNFDDGARVAKGLEAANGKDFHAIVRGRVFPVSPIQAFLTALINDDKCPAPGQDCRGSHRQCTQ